MKLIYNKAHTIFTLLLFSMISMSYAQQDVQYTNYMYNTVSVNPAYAGNRGVLSLTSIYRTQWVGLEGAPKTLMFSANAPVGNNVGLGLSFFSDQIGISDENNLAVDFSYSLKMNEKTKLSFGLKGGFNMLNVNFNELNVFTPSPVFSQNIKNRFSPVIGFGMYLHNSDKWYLGLSTPNVITTEHYDSTINSTANELMHIYLTAGYVMDIDKDFKFKPTVLLKSVKGAPLAVDLTANFSYRDKLILGAAYRLDAAVSGLLGLQISDDILVGYSYDHSTTELGNYNSGAHELLLRFELRKTNKKTVNPRFF